MANLTMALGALTGLILAMQLAQTIIYRTFSPGSFGGQADLHFGDLPAMLTFFAVVALGTILGWAQIIVGIIWMYRASDNVTRRGITERTWGPGWAIGAWFIPFANLVLGFFVIREIWNGSQPGVTNQTWKQVPLPAWIGIWWAFYVATYVISYASSGYSMVRTFSTAFSGSASPPSTPDLFPWMIASVACYIIAGVFFLRFIKATEEMQDSHGAGLPALPQAL